MSDSILPQRQALPARAASQPIGSPVQQVFREAMQAVESLREQLQQLRASQAATRQAYWQQVGPVAAATIAARRALYAPLEHALVAGYLSRTEEQQVTELLVHNARSLQERFGEDETAILARYAALPPSEDLRDNSGTRDIEADAPAADMLPHEAAAQARARRQQQRQRTQTSEARAAEAANQALLQNTKAAYRQLARLHHPDRAAQADATTQRAHTTLMQQITAAYAAGDLAGLLALLATDSPSTPPDAETERLLSRYTEALAQQQQQLAQQLAAARQPVADAPWSGTEKQQRTRLREIKRSLRAEADYLTYLVRELHDPAALRQVLRELTASRQTEL